MKDLDQHIKTFYNAKSLSAEELGRIKSGKTSSTSLFSSAKWLWRSAAVFALIITSVLVLNMVTKHHRYSVALDYAREVALNHEKALSSDIESNSILELNEQMTKLDFSMILPDQISSKYTLKGARYCSINFHIAAQLKIEDTSGAISTLYLFKKMEDFPIDQKIILKDTEITLWDNENLVYALASDL